MMIALLAAGCNKVDSLEEYFEKEGITPQTTDLGLNYTIITPGDATKITPSDFIQFHFKETNIDGDQISDSRQSIGRPVAFQVSEVIGWLQNGLSTIGVGGKAVLYVTPKLIYEVEVVRKFESVGDFNDTILSEYIADNGLTAMRTSSGLYVVIEEAGNGRFPIVNSTVTVHYRGYFVDGQQFDSSYDRGETATFGLRQVISGWTEGLQLMDEGSKSKLLIPSTLGYGSQGNSSIPPNSPLVFDIELVSF